jgi:hypothetical protein
LESRPPEPVNTGKADYQGETMLLYLTNANQDHRLKPIIINSDNVLSMTRDDDRGITFLFMPPHGTWEVCETLEEIHGQLTNSLAYRLGKISGGKTYDPKAPVPNISITPTNDTPAPVIVSDSMDDVAVTVTPNPDPETEEKQPVSRKKSR